MHIAHHRTRRRGFTLVELLVVIAIIGVLSTIAVVGFATARAKARVASAQADLRQMATAVNLLAADTGKWPNGCAIEDVANPEIYLSSGQAGIAAAPVVGDQGDGCVWLASDIAKWSGPYATGLIDPWGNGYYFDPDYRKFANCAGETEGPETPTLVSFGPNGVGPNQYDCDDITFELR